MSISRPRLWIATSSAILVVLALAGCWIWWSLAASEPILAGMIRAPWIAADVTIVRDRQGIPSIDGQSRDDIAYGLGFLHAQERFFQMDLLRRNSAGELSELVGEAAFQVDSRQRVHQFRKRAERAVAALAPAEASLAASYTAGVNAGLRALAKAPFEYLLLGVDPQPWRDADSFLVLYSMYLDLQPGLNEYDRSLGVLHDLLPADWFAFLTPRGGDWDAPVQGEAMTWAPVLPEQPLAELQADPAAPGLAALDWLYRDAGLPGSNGWTVAGRLTDSGSGLLANDMHLGLREPNIWYRASWVDPDTGFRLAGVTLPGVPTLVAGSNGHIAWGYTNSYGDYQDSIILRVSDDGDNYLTPDGWEAFAVDTETIAIKGAAPRDVTVKLTRWGPVTGQDQRGRSLALRWVAHDLEGANFNLAGLERTTTVEQALALAPTVGMPGQNFNVVDDRGNQAWTIIGRLPRRFGFDADQPATRPADWSDGRVGWNGYLRGEDYPRIVNPANGRIWTANARIVSGADLARVGEGGYALGARQRQVRDDLLAGERFMETDMLAIALDDRAVFLARWRQLLLTVMADVPALSGLREQVEQWQGRASRTSVGYRAVRLFRNLVVGRTVGEVMRRVQEQTGNFWPGEIDNMFEYPVWTLVSEKPVRHVPRGYDSWDDLLTATARRTLALMTADGAPLAEQTWGKANSLAIRHPLSAAVPLLSHLTDMPARPMDGDTYMPRVQGPAFGASERMVVAPGHEEQGIFHMATGQSAHPLSPYFDRGHRDWVAGNPSPFLPGKPRWRLVLKTAP